MSQNRCVFTVGNEPDNNRSAKFLSDVFYPACDSTVKDLSNDDCFGGVVASDLQKMVFLGHGSTTTYGSYSAGEFVKEFKRKFRSVKSGVSKDQVKDLYLIGCDVGLINDENGGSLAQDIANDLYREGFHKVIVHCVAKPENAKGDVLYVEVINCSGVGGLLALTSALAHKAGRSGDIQSGYLKAYLLNSKDAGDLEKYQKNSSKNFRKIQEIIREKSFLFINHANPEVELNKPQHVFYPNESPANRKLRVVRETAGHYHRMHAEAISLIVHRSAYLAQKSKVKEVMMSKRLDFIITQMRMADENNWHVVIGDCVRYLKNHFIYGVFFNDGSPTVKLLEALSKRDLSAANKIIDNQDSKASKLSTNHEKTGSIFHFRKHKNAEAVDEIKQSDISADLMTRIRILSQNLENEIEDLQASCFPLLHRFEITTKTTKLNVVNELQQCTSVHELQMIAKTAMENWRVNWSVRHTRTLDLLQEIDSLSLEPLLSVARSNTN